MVARRMEYTLMMLDEPPLPVAVVVAAALCPRDYQPANRVCNARLPMKE